MPLSSVLWSRSQAAGGRVYLMDSVMWDRPELAECYDRVSDLQFESGQELIRLMGVKKGDAVLDVGCGTGRLALYVSKIVGPMGRVVGIDPSPYRIRLAEDKLKKAAARSVTFQIGRGEDLHSLSTGDFRHVYYSSVFHWIEDKKAALRETFRVLKPGGRIGITTVDRNYPFAMKEIIEQLFARRYPGLDRLHETFFRMLVSRQELEELLTGAGFRDVRTSRFAQTLFYSSAQELFDFMEASSFGNFLREVPEGVRPQILADIGAELEKMRTERGIEFPSETLVVVGHR